MAAVDQRMNSTSAGASTEGISISWSRLSAAIKIAWKLRANKPIRNLTMA
jgi:hypothetical protein